MKMLTAILKEETAPKTYDEFFRRASEVGDWKDLQKLIKVGDPEWVGKFIKDKDRDGELSKLVYRKLF